MINRNSVTGQDIGFADTVRILDKKLESGLIHINDLNALRKRVPLVNQVMFGEIPESAKEKLSSLSPERQKSFNAIFKLSQNFVLSFWIEFRFKRDFP